MQFNFFYYFILFFRSYYLVIMYNLVVCKWSQQVMEINKKYIKLKLLIKNHTCSKLLIQKFEKRILKLINTSKDML